MSDVSSNDADLAGTAAGGTDVGAERGEVAPHEDAGAQGDPLTGEIGAHDRDPNP